MGCTETLHGLHGSENLEIPVWKVLQRNQTRRYLWRVVFTFCGFTFAYQTTDRLRLLIDSPKSAAVALKLAESLQFPAITICPGYTFRKSARQDQTVDIFGCAREQSYNCDWQYPWNVFTHTESMLRKCTFKNTINCLPGAEKRGRWERFLTSLGRCFTYKSEEKLTIAGSSNGLALSLDPEMHDRTGVLVFNGVRVYIHAANDIPLVETTGINVNVGAIVSYALILKQYEWIYDAKSNPCIDPDESEYSKNKCITKCINNLAMMEANVSCRAPFMTLVDGSVRICSNRKMCNALWTKFLEIKNVGRHWKTCGKQCPDECNKMTYTPVTTSLGFTGESNTSLLNINIYFRGMMLEKITEEWDYNWSEFISDTGGSLNLFWGVSIILFIQGLDFMLIRVYLKLKSVKTAHGLQKHLSDSPVTVITVKSVQNQNVQVMQNKTKTNISYHI